MRIETETTAEVRHWLRERIEAGAPDAALLVTLFGGDRLICCDEAVVARDADGHIVGLATLAPDGEMGEGPTLVGLYVVPGRRRRGIGTQLVIAAVKRMAERGLVPVRVDVITTSAKRLIE